jgi:hypothetical protein
LHLFCPSSSAWQSEGFVNLWSWSSAYCGAKTLGRGFESLLGLILSPSLSSNIIPFYALQLFGPSSRWLTELRPMEQNVLSDLHRWLSHHTHGLRGSDGGYWFRPTITDNEPDLMRWLQQASYCYQLTMLDAAFVLY